MTADRRAVDPRIGTGGLGFAHGSCFVGAVVPHGLAKPGPDTSGLFGTVNFQHYSGYFAEDNKIRGFSQLHLHGTGATDYGILSLMPTLAFDREQDEGHRLRDAVREGRRARRGRLLRREARERDRGRAHRDQARRASIATRCRRRARSSIDLDKALEGGMVDARARSMSRADEITGSLHHKGGMSGGFGGYTLYFVDRASTAPDVVASTSPSGDAAPRIGVGAATGCRRRSRSASRSSRSTARARTSPPRCRRSTSMPVARRRARCVGAASSTSCKLTGGTEAQRRTFYTSLYHAFLMPTVIDDVDGTVHARRAAARSTRRLAA